MIYGLSAKSKLRHRKAVGMGLVMAVGSYSLQQSASALDWESKTAYIEMASGEPRGSGQFVFANNTSNTVRIIATKTSCDCTVVQPEKHVFAPGEKGTLKVHYSSKGNTGRRTYVIAVTTNEGGRTVYHLKLVVDTYPEISVSPRTVVWENGEEREEKKATVSIDAGSAVKLTSAVPDRDVVAVEIIPGDKPGCSILRLTPHAKHTIGQARIRLSTDPKIKDSVDSLLFVLLR